MSRTIVRVVVCCLVLARVAHAQATATVNGAITDSSDAVVAGATVDAVVVDRTVARTTTTNDGSYRVQVPAGVPYQLRVRATGFADFVADMPAGTGTLTRDVRLQVGGVSDTVVVTALRGAEGRANATNSVTVMTSDDIGSLGSHSLSEALRFVPGLAVEGTGREGAVTSLFSRGGESDYNLVLIDGVRANLDGGQFDFSRLAGLEIERVEVVRGAQSSLWGSDAMGAVVQVFTRRGGVNDAPTITGSVESGSFNTVRSDARITGGALHRADYQAGVTYRKTDGAFGDILPQDDRYEQTAFDGGLGATLGSRASLRTNVRYSRDKAVRWVRLPTAHVTAAASTTPGTSPGRWQPITSSGRAPVATRGFNCVDVDQSDEPGTVGIQRIWACLSEPHRSSTDRGSSRQTRCYAACRVHDAPGDRGLERSFHRRPSRQQLPVAADRSE